MTTDEPPPPSTPADEAPGASEADAASAETSKRRKADPAKRLTRIVLVAVAVMFGCHMAADRYTPYTTLGRIDGFVVPIVPQVSGYLTTVGVRLHEVVSSGQVIAQIDPLPYQLALQGAQASLELAGRGISVLASSGTEEALPLLPGRHEFDLPTGSGLSVIALSALTGLSLKGLQWSLDKHDVKPGSSLTLSNQVTGPFHVELEEGSGVIFGYPPDLPTNT